MSLGSGNLAFNILGTSDCCTMKGERMQLCLLHQRLFSPISKFCCRIYLAITALEMRNTPTLEFASFPSHADVRRNYKARSGAEGTSRGDTADGKWHCWGLQQCANPHISVPLLHLRDISYRKNPPQQKHHQKIKFKGFASCAKVFQAATSSNKMCITGGLMFNIYLAP